MLTCCSEHKITIIRNMFKNPNYVYGREGAPLPSKLQFGDFILRRIRGHGDKIALINGATDSAYKYSELTQHVMNAAVSYAHLGLRKGQTVGICSENRTEFFGAIIGISCAGGVVTTINPSYVEGEVRHVMKISKPKFVICSPATYKTHGKTFRSLPHVQKIILFGTDRKHNTILYNDLTIPVTEFNNGHDVFVNRLARNVRYEEFDSVDVAGQSEVAFVLYSSGTTGLPKGVMLTHLNLISACNLVGYFDIKKSSLTIAPWYHTIGLMGTLTSIGLGRTMVYLPKFEVDLYQKTIEKYKIQQLALVPPVIIAVCKSPAKYDLSSVDTVYSGGAPLHKETADLVKTKFPNVKNVMQGYGMTETSLALTRADYTVPEYSKIGSVGIACPDVIIKIVDIESRQTLGPNQTGEICAKGPLVMKGYLGKSQGDDFDDEGFFKTGDIGYYDEDGCFFIVDRLKELIKYKAFQVAPAEIENVLLNHEAVRDAGVVGVPDKAAGEVPLAFVVKQTSVDVTAKELQQYVAERLSNPKHLRGGVRFVEAIPKNPSGKILRKELRKLAKKVTSKL